MTLLNWQLSFRDLTMGDGTPYVIQEVSGLSDAPSVRSSDIDRARSHGQFPGSVYASGRLIRVSVNVNGQHPNESVWAAFSRAHVVGVDESPLSFKIPGVAGGGEAFVNARLERMSNPNDKLYASGIGKVDIDYKCSDPLLYSSTLTTVTTSTATSTGGIVAPITAPITGGSSTSGGLLIASNLGEFDAPWTATITGPVINPRIENVTSGKSIALVGSLAAGETLTVASREKTILLGGTASRYSWLAQGSQWFDLAPGSSTIRFAGTSGAGSMTLSFRSCWI